jgi:NAD(P)H-hydrate repair Nnr-like enzyme with NAD(P)H-hydrate dehydratase domain
MKSAVVLTPEPGEVVRTSGDSQRELYQTYRTATSALDKVRTMV